MPGHADERWDAVVAAARKEGEAVLYTSNAGSRCLDQNLATFRSAYGINVQVMSARGSEIQERIRVEQSSGRFVGDVNWTGDPAIYLQAQNGALERLGKIPNAANVAAPLVASEYSVPVFLSRISLLVNARLVNPEQDLKSWRDLLSPKWSGKILTDRLDVPGAGNAFFQVTNTAFGQDFHERLARQKLEFTREIGTSQRRVAQGEYAVFIPAVTQYMMQVKGLPVRYWVPQEGAPYYTTSLSVLKNAPHPNAARVLINHLLATASQVNCARDGAGPTVTGVVEQLEPELQDMHGQKLIGAPDPNPDAAAAGLALAKQIYK